MSEPEGPVEPGSPESDDLGLLQRRAEEIERRLKVEWGKAWVAERLRRERSAAPQDDSGTLEAGDTSSQAEEEPTSAGLTAVKLRQRHLKLKQRKQDMKLRRKLADYAIWLVIAQVLVANVLFAFYLGHNAYDADASVMIAWLSATVVEVVGILWVIARNLFPYRDKSVPGRGRDSRRATN